jgi:signal peptidase I
MNKLLKRLLFFVLAFVLIFILFRQLQWVTVLRAVSDNMHPTLSIGNWYFAIGVKHAKMNEIVIYYSTMRNKELSSGRIVGLPGDTIHIVNGLLFRNNKFVDDTLKLSYLFNISDEDAKRVSNSKYFNALNLTYQPSSDTKLINLTYDFIMNNKIKSKRHIDTVASISSSNFNSFPNTLWTTDNFGPAIVPPNCVFIIGDNRGDSFDSRQRGFVPNQNLIFKILK